MAYYIIVTTNNDVFVVSGFLFQHLAFCYFQTTSNGFNHFFMFSA